MSAPADQYGGRDGAGLSGPAVHGAHTDEPRGRPDGDPGRLQQRWGLRESEVSQEAEDSDADPARALQWVMCSVKV